MKGKGKGQGCFICGDPNHWSKECPKGKGRMSAVTEEEGQQEGNQEDWSQDAEWYGDEWSSWDDYDWSQDWIGSLDDWSATTGLGVLRTGGVLSSRMQVHLQVRKALRMSRRIPPRVSHRRMLRLDSQCSKAIQGRKPQ